MISREKFGLTTTDSRACHLSFEEDHIRSLLLKRYLKVIKADAEPTREPTAAIGNPFIPYAKPQRVTTVVCPIQGGKEIITRKSG